jgi:hypothetical protein
MRAPISRLARLTPHFAQQGSLECGCERQHDRNDGYSEHVMVPDAARGKKYASGRTMVGGVLTRFGRIREGTPDEDREISPAGAK